MSSDIGRSTVFTISMKTNGRCFYCNRPAQVVDHFIPRKSWVKWGLDKVIGSYNLIENLFPACSRCNTIKIDRNPSEFMGSFYTARDRYLRANARIGITSSQIFV